MHLSRSVNFRHSWLSVLLLVSMAVPVAAQESSSGAAVLPLDPAVHTGKLSNGFTYFIRRNTEPKARVVLYLVNKVGSILETDEQRGLAHFMEHMSFNGTTYFPKNALVDYLQRAGVRFGADLNAYTGFDETVYQLPLPSDKPELLENGFQIMRDWAREATLDPVEIDKERGVVLEEKRLGKGASERMRLKYWPVLLNHSRYADRMPIGTDTVLKNFKPATLRAFYQDWYRPDQQALIVVGDINVDSVEAIVKAKFADLANPVNEKTRTKYTIGLTGKNQFVKVTDPEMPQTVVEILIKHIAPKLRTRDDYHASIVRNLFVQMLQQRYAELAQQPDVPFIQAGAGIEDFLGELDLYGANVAAKPGKLEASVKALWRETIRAKKYGFTAGELNRAKQDYLHNIETVLQEKDKTNSTDYVQEYQSYFLKGDASPGVDSEYAMVKQDLPAVSLDAVNAVAKTYITETDRDILILAPEKEKASLPDEATVIRWLKEVETGDLQAYKDDVRDKQLLAQQPVPGHVVNIQADTAVRTTTLTLSNGVKVVLKPTDFKNNEILFTAFAAGGTSLYDDKDYPSAANAVTLVTRGGVGDFNLIQLNKYLAGKQLSVEPSISDRTQGISGSSTKEDLETALQLVYLYFTAPRKDSSSFLNTIGRWKAELANRASDPNTVFSDTISAVLGNYNIRRMGPSLKKIAQIDLNKAYRIYRERFADASDFVFTFVGSFDTATLRPLLEQYLGSLPALNRHEAARDLGIHPPAGQLKKTVRRGREAKATVRLFLTGEYSYAPQENQLLDALAEVLEIRLIERLREDEGGVYSPGAFVNYAKYPHGRYGFTIAFGCAPANVEKLIASTLDEIAKLRASGPLPQNLEKYKAETRRSNETELKTNNFWLSYLSGQLQTQESLDEVTHEEEALDKVTVDALRDAAVKYMSGKDLLRFVLMPQ